MHLAGHASLTAVAFTLSMEPYANIIPNKILKEK